MRHEGIKINDLIFSTISLNDDKLNEIFFPRNKRKENALCVAKTLREKKDFN
jgi:hypothetical protein